MNKHEKRMKELEEELRIARSDAGHYQYWMDRYKDRCESIVKWLSDQQNNGDWWKK